MDLSIVHWRNEVDSYTLLTSINWGRLIGCLVVATMVGSYEDVNLRLIGGLSPTSRFEVV